MDSVLSMDVRSLLKVLVSSHLLVRNVRLVLKYNPLHDLTAGWCGQRAVVDEILLCGVGQQTLEAEGWNLSTLSWSKKEEIYRQKLCI